MSEEEDAVLTKEQAKQMIVDRPDGMVHTFSNPTFGLIGGDHTLKSVLESIDNCFQCRLTGKRAMATGHGLVIIPSKTCKQSDLLFVETKSVKEES